MRQSESKGWLEAVAQQLLDELHLPAVWLAVSQDERIEAVTRGVRKVGDPTPAMLDDKLTIASISKPMAGLWIATLVEQGVLTYETRVLEALPELEGICLPEHREITLEQLLVHTAGVIRDAKNFPSDLRLDQYPAERLRQAREVLSTPAPAGTKGKSVYSNNGVTLGVTMAERRAREPYESAAGKLYRERFGLASWGVWPMNLRDDTTLPWPHTIKAGKAVAAPPRSVQFQFSRPSGSAHCTIADLVRFGMLATNSAALSRTVLRPTGWDALASAVTGTPTTRASFLATLPGVYSHSGSLGTTSSELLVITPWRVAFGFHTNSGGDAIRDLGLRRLTDAFRKRRAEKVPPAACALALTEVTTVDSTWENIVTPKKSDDKLRIRIRFKVEARGRTGDLQTLVRVGDTERVDNRYTGLAAGMHRLHFEFEMPKDARIPVLVQLDSLGTAANRTTKPARFETVLTLEDA